MFKYKVLFLLLFCWGSIHADWTVSPPSPITSSSTTISNVYTSFNPSTGQFLATWPDSTSNLPIYSFYTPGSGWGPIDTISPTFQVDPTRNVITSCDPTTGKFLATWNDLSTNSPTYSIYTPGSGWSTPDTIPIMSASSSTNGEVSNLFVSTTGKFLATWADANNASLPTYSFYTPGTGWSTFDTITTSSTASNIFTTLNSTTGDILAVWTDTGSGAPTYSFYSSGAWGSESLISGSADVDNDVLCSCNPITGQYIAVWVDINIGPFYPFFSIFTPGTGWSPKATITTTLGVLDNVTVSFDPATGQYLALWSNSGSGDQTYSFYNPGSGWASPVTFSTTTASGGDVNSVFNSKTGQFLFTWTDFEGGLFSPTYSFFANVALPPLTFTGSVIRNRFLSQTDLVHKLVWTPPSDTSAIAGYQITRNSVIIAVVPVSDPSVYYDHNRSKKEIDVYTIASVTAFGIPSPSLSITLP